MTDKQSPAWRREFQLVPAAQRWGKYLLLLGVALGNIISVGGFASNDEDMALRFGFSGLLLAFVCLAVFFECLARHISQDVCSRMSKMFDDRIKH